MHPLDNPAWSALTGPQAHFADSAYGMLPLAQRFQPSVCPFAAVERLDAERWSALAEMVGPGGLVVLFQAEISPAPNGWRTVYDARCHQMVRDEAVSVPTCSRQWRELDESDSEQMLALTALTQPGPFLPQTHRLGRYVGVFSDDGALVAMAGERMRPEGYSEISAVCTDPGWTGQGLAGVLTSVVADHIAATGSIPFLHVVTTNDRARSLYERLGFRHRTLMQISALVAPG